MPMISVSIAESPLTRNWQAKPLPDIGKQAKAESEQVKERDSKTGEVYDTGLYVCTHVPKRGKRAMSANGRRKSMGKAEREVEGSDAENVAQKSGRTHR